MAQASREVSGARIELCELLDAPEEMCAIDLGEAPRPGSSRVVRGDEVLRQVRAAGFDASRLDVPRSVRIHAPGKRYDAAALNSLVRPHVEASLPRGVALDAVQVRVALTLAPDAVVARVHLPKIAKRVGATRIALSVELTSSSGSPPTLLPAVALVTVSEAAAQYDVTRGKTVELQIVIGAARVSARAVALQACDVGDHANFRVVKTGRTLRGRLVSENMAIVAGGS